MHRTRRVLIVPLLLLGAFITLGAPALAFAGEAPFLSHFHQISTLTSTVPANGDVNPYGTFVVPNTVGNLKRGHVMVSNFNNSANAQGTGTTLVQISPQGKASAFAQINPTALPGACPGGVGLTTALVVLQRGWVIVGSLPTSDGTSATAQAGCLLVLDSHGTVVETISGGAIDGPWDMTVLDAGSRAWLFVTNVLNGTVAANGNVVNKGTVVRLALKVPSQGYGKPSVESSTTIAANFAERTDPAALVVGPTGVALSGETLYVADSVNNRIAAIPDALDRTSNANAGKTVSATGVLNDPLGLTLAPNGDILSVNGNDGNIVETTPDGEQVAHDLLDATSAPPAAPGAGCLFGLAVVPGGDGIYFVDDCDNTLKLFDE